MEDNIDNIELKFLYIETSGSEGLAPPAGDENTMTVQELIDYLNRIKDKNMKVYLLNDGGAYRGLTDSDFEEVWI